MQPLFALAAVTLVAGTAFADAGVTFVSDKIGSYAFTATVLWTDPDRATAEDRNGDACLELLASERKRGVLDEDRLRSKHFARLPYARVVEGRWTIAFKDAPKVCEEYDRERMMHTARGVYQDMEAWLGAAPIVDDDETFLRQSAETCVALTRQLVAKKFPDRPMQIGALSFTFSTAEAKLCHPLALHGEVFASGVRALKQAAVDEAARYEAWKVEKAKEEKARQDVADARADVAYRKLSAKLARYGMAGARLALVAGRWESLLGPGGRDLTLKQMATAPVMFESWQDATRIFVTRHVLRGNKVVSQTTRSYSRAAYDGRDAGRLLR